MRKLLWLLAASVVACSDTTEPTPVPVDVAILVPGSDEAFHELDPLVLIGEAGASDFGPLPDDSLQWIYGRQIVGRGRRVVTRALLGRQTAALIARYGPRTASATIEIEAAPGGLARHLWTVPLDINQADALVLDPASGTLYAHDQAGQVAVAIGLDGSVRWRVELGIRNQRSPPAVGLDGALYYGFWVGPVVPEVPPGGVLALNPDGTRRWVFAAADYGPPGSMYYHSHGGVALDADDNIYVATEEEDSPIYSLRPDGTLRWRTGTDTSVSRIRFLSYATLMTDSLVGSLRRYDSLPVVHSGSGNRAWGAGTSGGTCLLASATGSDGTVYVPDRGGRLAAFTPAGAALWDKGLPVPPGFGSPVVGRDRIYFAAPNGGVAVLSLNGDSVATFGPAPTPEFHDGIALGANGVVYVAGNDTLFSYDAAGARRFATAIPHRVASSCYEAQGGPVIGPDGTVYLRASDAGVMAFRDTVGPATDAPWPTLQGDFTRRGQRATDRPAAPAAGIGTAFSRSPWVPPSDTLHYGRHAPLPPRDNSPDHLGDGPHRPAGGL